MSNVTINPSAELHVVFGTGALGKATMRALVGMGKQVRVINRSGKATDIPEGVEIVKGDAYNTADTITLTKNAAVVYQCAQPAYNEWAEKFPPLQAAILAGAAANHAKFIVAENLYMYGASNGNPIREDSPIAPISRKGRIRQAMSETLMAAHEKGIVRAAIGRASTFFGPEYDILAGLVFYPALVGKTINLFGRLDLPHTFTYIPDFGRALATLGTQDAALGQVWIAPCAPALTQRSLMDLLAKETGQASSVRAAGKLLMSIIGLFSAGTRETVEMMYEFDQPYIVDSSKIERTFGLTPTPTPTAIAETVAWFHAHSENSHQYL